MTRCKRVDYLKANTSRWMAVAGLIWLSVLWGAYPARADATHPAQQLVEKSVAEFLEVLRSDPEITERDADLRASLDDIVVPQVDFVTMTKLVVGKHWRKASDDQRVALVDEFTQFLLNTYVSAITEYKGGDVEFEKFVPEKREDRAVVRSRLVLAGSSDIPVVYKLREKDGWQIYDIEVSQLSLVTNYRASFANEIEKNGIDGLISVLHDRNQGRS